MDLAEYSRLLRRNLEVLSALPQAGSESGRGRLAAVAVWNARRNHTVEAAGTLAPAREVRLVFQNSPDLRVRDVEEVPELPLPAGVEQAEREIVSAWTGIPLEQLGFVPTSGGAR